MSDDVYTPFSPRVALIFENLETVRELLKICKPDGQLAEEVKRFMLWLEKELRRRITDIQYWKFIAYESQIALYPGRNWEVIANDFVCIAIDFISNEADLPLQDPGVRLYVPKKWEKRQEFIDELNVRLPPSLSDLRSHEPNWPLNQYIRLQSFTTNDLEPFLQKAQDLVGKLISLAPEINNILEKLKKV